MTLPTPPRYVVLPEEVIEQAYAPDKPRRALLASFTRILSLAWEAKYQHTPPLNEEELWDFLKLSRRQYFDQKADMELLGWLRSSHPRPGFVQFTFSRSVSEKVSVPDPSAENRTDGAETRTGDSLIGGELIDLDSDLKNSPPINTEASAENRTDRFPSALQILEQTPLLFDGAVVFSRGLADRNPLHVLGWCAYAYHKKDLTKPGGVVRNQLMENNRPPDWTLEQWPTILPEKFLEALELVRFGCDLCEQTFGKRAELESHLQSVHPFVCRHCDARLIDQDALTVHESSHAAVIIDADETVDAPVNGKLSAARAWQTVLDQLSMEMARGTFDTWVRDTKAVRYDGNALTIGVRNAYARDWLESRIQSTAERLLVGILNQSVEVIFVTFDQVQEVE